METVYNILSRASEILNDGYDEKSKGQLICFLLDKEKIEYEKEYQIKETVTVGDDEIFISNRRFDIWIPSLALIIELKVSITGDYTPGHINQCNHYLSLFKPANEVLLCVYTHKQATYGTTPGQKNSPPKTLLIKRIN